MHHYIVSAFSHLIIFSSFGGGGYILDRDDLRIFECVLDIFPEVRSFSNSGKGIGEGKKSLANDWSKGKLNRSLRRII